MTTEAPIRQFRPMRDVRADDRVRADRRALADSGRRMHVRRRIDEGGARLDGQQQLGLGDELAVHVGRAPAPWPAATASRPSVTSSRSRSPGTTLRRNLASLTPRSDTRAVAGAAARSRTSAAATWVSASIISTAGISGEPGKCPWKNSSLTVTFLTATSRLPGSCSVTASISSDGKR